MLKYISAFVQAQLWRLNCLYSEFEKFVMGRSDMYLCWSPIWDLFASLLIFLKQTTLFQLNCPNLLCAILLRVLAAGLNKQLCDGGDQEEDAGDEGGEGQPDGPLRQL